MRNAESKIYPSRNFSFQIVHAAFAPPRFVPASGWTVVHIRQRLVAERVFVLR